MPQLILQRAEVIRLSCGYPALCYTFNENRLAYLVAGDFDQLEIIEQQRVRLYDLDGETDWGKELPPDATTADPLVVRVAMLFIDIVNQPLAPEQVFSLSDIEAQLKALAEER